MCDLWVHLSITCSVHLLLFYMPLVYCVSLFSCFARWQAHLYSCSLFLLWCLVLSYSHSTPNKSTQEVSPTLNGSAYCLQVQFEVEQAITILFIQYFGETRKMLPKMVYPEYIQIHVIRNTMKKNLWKKLYENIHTYKHCNSDDIPTTQFVWWMSWNFEDFWYFVLFGNKVIKNKKTTNCMIK